MGSRDPFVIIFLGKEGIKGAGRITPSFGLHDQGILPLGNIHISIARGLFGGFFWISNLSDGWEVMLSDLLLVRSFVPLYVYFFGLDRCTSERWLR